MVDDSVGRVGVGLRRTAVEKERGNRRARLMMSDMIRGVVELSDERGTPFGVEIG